jgi:outer membrane immunogenic protein
MKARILGLLAATAITTAAVSTVSAADLPIREAPPPAPIIAAAPVFTWTGFYVGVNAGWGWRDNDDDNGIFVPAGTFAPPFGGVAGTLGTDNGEDDGFVGGGQIGYNVQFGAFVVGVEADIHWADFNVDNNIVSVPADFPPTFIPANLEDDDDMEWFGTVRARAGVAFGQALIYATGGLAYSDDNTGWVAGGGVEWAIPAGFLGSAATIGLEGLWVSLDEDDDDGDVRIGSYVPAPGGARVDVFAPGGNDDDESDFFVARAKLNFKFGTF